MNDSGMPVTLNTFASRLSFLAVVCLTCLAFAIRVHHLEAQSLWSDEGLSVYRARQSLVTNLQNEIVIPSTGLESDPGTSTTDTNPPLYFLLLAGLRAIAGQSEFALRFLSVCWGVLTVPLLFLTGHRLLGSNLGALCAAALGTLSPFYVWHSQELRMYPMVIDLAILSTLALSYLVWPDPKAAKRRRYAPYAVYALATVALLYTHYTGFYLLAFQGVVLLGAILAQRRWRVILSLGGATLAASPLILYALQRLGAGKEPYYGGFKLSRVAHELVSSFSLGWTFPPRRPAEQLVVPLGLLALGLLGLVWRRRAGVALYLAGWLVAPVLALYAILQVKSTYMGPRHMLIVSPAFYLAQAAGVAALARRWRPLGLAALSVVLVGMAVGLRTQFTDPAFVKDDLRGAAAYIAERARPGDVVVVHDAITAPTFDYYYDGDAPRIVIPPYPHQGQDDAIARLRQAAESYERVWFLYGPPPLSGFPAELLPAWADAHLFKLGQRGFEGLNFYVGVSTYTAESPVLEALPLQAIPGDQRWPSGLRLLAWEPPETLAVGRGGWFTFYWQQETPTQQDYVLGLQLLDAAGREWASSAGPAFQFFPAAEWPLGRPIHQEMFLSLPPGLPPTTYTLALSVREAQADPSVPLAERAAQSEPVGAPLTLGTVPVARSPSPLQPRQLDVRPWLAPLHLGDGVELLGAAFPDGPFRPGHPLWVRLIWGVDESPTADYSLQTRLVDRRGRVRSESQEAPSAAGFPTSAWRPQDLFYGMAYVRIPADADPGLYQLQTRLVDPANGASPGDWRALGLVKVQAWPLVAELPTVEHTLSDVRLGDRIDLRGYDLSQTELGLDLTLYWQANALVEADYIVFIHLGLPDASPAAQTDGIPGDWLRPTSGWRVGEIIADPHHIPLADDVPSGTYTLYAGLYTHEARLPVWVDGQIVPDSRVPLLAIEVKAK